MHFVLYRYCCEGRYSVNIYLKCLEKSANLIMTGEWPPGEIVFVAFHCALLLFGSDRNVLFISIKQACNSGDHCLGLEAPSGQENSLAGSLEKEFLVLKKVLFTSLCFLRDLSLCAFILFVLLLLYIATCILQ